MSEEQEKKVEMEMKVIEHAIGKLTLEILSSFKDRIGETHPNIISSALRHACSYFLIAIVKKGRFETTLETFIQRFRETAIALERANGSHMDREDPND